MIKVISGNSNRVVDNQVAELEKEYMVVVQGISTVFSPKEGIVTSLVLSMTKKG